MWRNRGLSIARSAAVLLAVASLLGGCDGARDVPIKAIGAAPQDAYRFFPAPQPDGELPAYRIGALDKISVTVYQEEGLSVESTQVDAAGKIVLPLIGEVSAAGKTSIELGDLVGARLGVRYLEHPQVSVVVVESVSQKVTVEGSVNDPGVFPIKGRTTLLDSLAMAKGPSRVAALDEAVIFREIGGQRIGATFNIVDIRNGRALDPEIRGNDTVVVGLSNLKAAWRDILTASPLIAATRPF